MSSTQFNDGSSYGLSAEVKNRLLSKYDPEKEAELRSWIKGLTCLSVGPDFQKGLKDGIILCTLMDKLQPGSVPKMNRSMKNWHQLENLSNFIEATVSYGVNPVDVFEANGLFESGNTTQVQVSLLALARKMGTNQCASQSGMTAYGMRRHLYHPKNHILPPMDHSTVSLQMAPPSVPLPGRGGTSDTKLGTDKCDNSSMSLQMGYTQGTNQSGQVFGLGQQIYDPKYCPQGTMADGAPSDAGDCPGPGEVPEYPPYYQEEAGY
uniref:Calponin-2 n=1 Tax=Aotus nancymaae TaxID=37293 RepID=A0A2K5E2J1_AOTNA